MAITDKPPTILIFGVGSIGAVYLYELLTAGCLVTAVCRSNYSQVKEHGFTLNSVRHGNVKYRPTAVVRDVSECQSQTFDYVLVCSKSFPGSKPSLAEILRPVLEGKPEAAIILAQNGIGTEDEFAAAYPDHTVVSGVVYLPATQTAPGIINYPEMLNLFELGTYPADASSSAKAKVVRFADLIRRGGGAAEVHDDVQVARWNKLVMNASWNPVCALSLCSDGEWLQSSDSAYDLSWKVMLEVIAIANALRIPSITEDLARRKLQILVDRSNAGTERENSMLQDVKQGRPFEVEAILGNIVRIARKAGVDVPRLETLYALLKGRLAVQIRTANR